LQRLIIILFIFLFIFSACSKGEDKAEPVVFKKVPEIEEIRPQKPVRIKLKRNTKGEYSWDISGENADEIINVDRRLRDALKTKASGQRD
jgi:hypothetical protein